MGLLGAHMSIAGGLEKAIERGDEMGCESIQIFTQSSRTWKTNPLTETEINAFKSAFKKAKTVKRVVAHNSYLLNLSTETH
jgi:deoxyribonuclease-4